MPYVGGKLQSIASRGPQAATRTASRSMAHKGGDRMTSVTVINTPIKSGNLRTSWYQLPTTRVHVGPWPAYRSGVASQVPYAPDVEYGTGLWGPRHAKYEIKPKDPSGFLRWIDPRTGKEVFAKRVMHPGSPGQHMIQIAGEVTEFETDAGLMADVLAIWVAAVESYAGKEVS